MNKPRLEDTDRGTTVFFNRYLYSKRDPSRRPRLVAKAAPQESHCLYIVPSPLLGYGIEELLECISNDSHIIAVEASQDIFHLCSPRIGKALQDNPRLSLVRLSNEESLQVLLDDIGLWRFRRIRRVDLNAGAAIFPEIYNRLTAFTVNALATYWRNRHALGVLGRHWIRHLFANLTVEHSQAPRCRTGKPIIIVGAGPSLDESLDFMVRYRNQLEIWSTDTALSALLSSDITPDMVCVLETQSWNHLDFHGAINKGIDIMADITSYPGSFGITGGHTSFYSSSFANLKFLDRLHNADLGFQVIPALGSVGLSTVYLALSSSDGPIFLTGLDFAYSPGKTHARGSSVHVWQLAHRTRTDPLPGWASTMKRPRLKAKDYRQQDINTDKILTGYADLFRDRFASSQRLYTLSGGLDLAVPLINQCEALQIIAQSRQGQTQVSAPNINRQRRVMNFICDEMHRLDRVIEVWESCNDGKADESEVVQALEELDQIYCDFPDKPPLPKADKSFLFRAVKRCRELRQYIQRVGGVLWEGD